MNGSNELTGNEEVRNRTSSLFFLKSGFADKAFEGITAFFAFLILFLAVLTAFTLWKASAPTIEKMGWQFLTSSDWDPVQGVFGSLPFVYGTLLSSFLALLIATPFGIGISLFLTELSPMKWRDPVAFLIEILAAIPSVVYGLWGMFLLAPFMRVHVDPILMKTGLPFFKGPSTGLSLLTAGIILSIMILPTITAISREVFEAVPNPYRESARALGATRWETILLAVVSPARVGVLGAIMLALGRALGETMAVTMVIGNNPQIVADLLAPSHSMASVIANEFSEATSDLHISALAEIGLLLMVITLVLNIAANLLVWATAAKFQK
ncbi:MAG TPA: phosphate ABC transporter permease subunit PstC [bacterium]|nr:phosphate ABC transporter permease subunit PstC [bacterium]